jgi:hypothetical protein
VLGDKRADCIAPEGEKMVEIEGFEPPGRCRTGFQNQTATKLRTYTSIKMVGKAGFEPAILFFPKEAGTARLPYFPIKLGCPLGFEPRLTDSQTGVLTVNTMDTLKLYLPLGGGML